MCVLIHDFTLEKFEVANIVGFFCHYSDGSMHISTKAAIIQYSWLLTGSSVPRAFQERVCFCTSCIKIYLERMRSKAQAFNHSSMQASESMYSHVQTRLADKCFSQFRTVLYIIILIEVQHLPKEHRPCRLKGSLTDGHWAISLFLIYAFNSDQNYGL